MISRTREEGRCSSPRNVQNILDVRRGTKHMYIWLIVQKRFRYSAPKHRKCRRGKWSWIRGASVTFKHTPPLTTASKCHKTSLLPRYCLQCLQITRACKCIPKALFVPYVQLHPSSRSISSGDLLRDPPHDDDHPARTCTRIRNKPQTLLSQCRDLGSCP
jgi:hypothetical protein